MGTFWGDMLRLLGKTGFDTAGTIIAGSLMKDWAQQGELKNWLARQTYEAAAGGGEDVQVPAQESIEKLSGFKVPMVTRLKTITGAGPGGETAQLAQGISSQGGKLSWVPDTLSPSTTPIGVTPEVTKRLLTPSPKLEQLSAEEVRGSGLSPTSVLLAKTRALQPRGEFNLLSEAALKHPNPTIRALALKKLQMPEESLALRQEIAAANRVHQEATLDLNRQRLQDNTNFRALQLQLAMQEATRRGDETERRSLQQVLDKHNTYAKLLGAQPGATTEDAILTAGRTYETARAAYAEAYPQNLSFLPPSHTEEEITSGVRAWLRGPYKQAVRPSDTKAKPPTPSNITPPTIPTEIETEGGKAIYTGRRDATGTPLYRMPDGSEKAWIRRR